MSNNKNKKSSKKKKAKNLPVPVENNDSISLNTHSFNNEIQQIKGFAEKTSTEISFPTVANTEGLFDLFDHKVTGEELNKLTGQIQRYLIECNNNTVIVINEFEHVYRAMDALDKDYFSVIMENINALKDTNKRIDQTQQELKRTIEQLKKTLEIFRRFKTHIDSLEHLSDIDSLWNECQQNTANLLIVSNDLDNLKNNFSQISECLEKFVNQKHFNDIDIIWRDNEQNIADIDLLKQNQTILQENQLKTDVFLDKLNEINHLFETDSLWEMVNSNYEELNDKIEKSGEEINRTNNQLEENTKKYDLEIQHLTEKIDSMNEKMEYQNQKIKKGYYFNGILFAIIVIQFILILVGVI